MAGFLGKKLYAMIAEIISIRKFPSPLCLECTACTMFLSSSLIVSMTDLFLSNILSLSGISLFFIFDLIPVTKCIPSLNNASKSVFEIYPLSPYDFPNMYLLNTLNTSGLRSSTLALVRQKFNNSP